jgi:DNA-binding MarR family transcriptional regulator
MDQNSFFEDNLGFIIGKVHRQLRKEWQGQLSELNITTAQAAILSLVNESPHISQRDASRALEIDVMAVRRVLQDLVDKNFLEMKLNPSDSRKFSYAVTAEGKSLAQKIFKLAKEQNHRLASVLGPVAYKQIGLCLAKILEQPSPRTASNSKN